MADLTGLIAAHWTWHEVDEDGSDHIICACGTTYHNPQRWAEHLKFVVEQHANGRIAELEARIANAQSLCNATGRYNAARQKHWNIRVFACDVLAALKGRAALEGEQQ